MDIFTESFSIFSKLRTAQKLVFLRVFIVINVSAFFLATRARFESDTANSISMFVIYALETCFMLWLGFKRGQRYHYEVGTGTSALPTARKVPMAKWYGSAAAVSLLVSAITTVIVGNTSDDLTTVEMIIFFVVEVAIMGLSLLQGLRIGWNTVSVDSSIPVPSAATTISASSATIGISPNVPLPPEDEAKAKKRAQNIRRGQIALGCISVICAVLAVYFHIVAHEMTQPDPEGDAAAQVVSQALGGGTASSPSAQLSPTAQAPVQAAAPSSSDVTQDTSSQTTVASAALPNALPPDDPKALWALQNAGAADPDGGAVNLDTFPFATSSGAKSKDGYPIYLIECNVGSHQCVGETGQSIGSTAQVADTITPVRNTDALRYSCPDSVCIDFQGNVVGSVAPAMRPYLAKTHSAAP
ncbi:hypothetical protein [Rhodanobacter sp. A1T4]|uniref:hypothetical protein n=1 Tax=Rhodanobacter sp. A1T4 TaxID=2723087 RepID=UPI0016215BA3|nr:hypothetical protein [Rhodanobacter sp. A1T4]MBB6248989.1 hypothetical protein [Rhodanobacter sp. A1T4]